MSITITGGITLTGSGWTVDAAPPPTGQQAFTTTGTFSFTVPADVTTVCAVCVGAGATGSSGTGGAGGSLRYINNLPVTPGETLTVFVATLSSKMLIEDRVITKTETEALNLIIYKQIVTVPVLYTPKSVKATHRRSVLQVS